VREERLAFDQGWQAFQSMLTAGGYEVAAEPLS
jgi:hypothetical protein